MPSAAVPPASVHFYPPGSDCATAAKCVNGSAFVSTSNTNGAADKFTLGYQVCGLGGVGAGRLGTFAGIGTGAVHTKVDDPNHYNSLAFVKSLKLKNPDGTQQSRSQGSEGNYPNAEVFTFKPQSADLTAGDTIDVSLPRPAASSGSVLPPPTTSLAQLGVSIVQTRSTVTYGPPVVPELINSPTGAPPNYDVVTVELASTHDGQVRLDAYDAGNPPPNGPKIATTSIWGLQYDNTGHQVWSAQGAGTALADTTTLSGTTHRFAVFSISSSANRTVTFTATDTATGLTVGRTLTLPFGTGSSAAGPCANASAAPSTDPQVAYNYLLVNEGHAGALASSTPPAFIAPSVAVRYASGQERASITVPAGFSASAQNGDTVKIVVLGATSPVACCQTSGSSGYDASQFSISTSKDVVPRSPSTDEALDYVAAFLPVDRDQSTITPSPSSAQAGSATTLTATVRDQFGNPIFNDTTAMYQTSTPRDALVTADNLPTGYDYPVSDHSGSVTYDVLDTCARTVTIGASDLGPADWDLTQPVTPPATYPTGVAFANDASITFTAGAPVAPDQVTTPSDCGPQPTKSSVTVTGPAPELQWRRAFSQPAQEGIGHHLTSISCAAANFCAAVDDTGRALVYDATRWTLPQQIDTYTAGTPPDTSHGNFFNAVSCPSPGSCVALDRYSRLFRYRNGAWEARTSFVLAAADRDLTLPLNGLPPKLTVKLSCASPTFCVVVDDRGDTFLYRGTTGDDGLPAYPIAGNPNLTSVSCAVSTTFCTAIDDRGKAYTTNDGASWSAPRTVADHRLNSVSCPTVSFCATVDTAGQAAVFDGTNWSPLSGVGPGGSDAASVSCPSAQFCYDSDGAYYDGSAWHIDAADQRNDYSRVSCASYAYCVKVYQDSFGTESNYESGPPIAPAGAPVDSSDTGHTAVVTVVLGDTYGNPASCHHVVLSPAASTMHASIEPLAPANPCSGAGTNGPGYSGTDGVARFRVTDESAQPVRLGVTDVTIAAVWSSNATLNPSDVAQVDFVDPYSVRIASVEPAAPVAGGAQGAVVTVRVADVAGQPDSGRSVSLRLTDDSPGRQAVVAPSGTALTGVDGAATFRVTDPRAETVTLEAREASGLTSNPPVSITFTNGGLSLTTDATAAVADGRGQQNIAFGLTDVDDAHSPIAGCVLAQASGHATIVTPNAEGCSLYDPNYPTDPELQKRYVWTLGRQFTLTDDTPETVAVTLTAVDSRSNGAQRFPPCHAPFQPDATQSYCVLIANTSVRFVGVPAQLTLAPAAGEIPGDGVTQLPLTVTALDAGGDPIAGVPVYLCPGRGSDGIASPALCRSPTDGSLEIGPGDGATAVGQPEEQVTLANGRATFVLDGRNAGGFDLHALVTPRYSSDVANLDGLPLVGAPPNAEADVTLTPIEAGSSQVCAQAPNPLPPCPQGPNPIPADGVAAATVAVSLQIGLQNHLGGHVVVLRTDSRTATVSPKDPGGALTKSDGTVRFLVADTKPGTVTISALDASTGVTVDATAAVVFSKPEASASTVTVTKGSVPVGSPTSPSVVGVLITLRDASGAAIVDAPTDVVALGPGGARSKTATLQALASRTDAGGVARYFLTDTAAETLTLRATDLTDSAHPITLAKRPSVTFTADVYSRSIVRASPATVEAGIGSSTLTVDLRDGAFQPVRGWTVTVPNPGLAAVTPLRTNVSDANGQVKFSVRDDRAEYFCATADATNCLQVMVAKPGGSPQLLVPQAAIEFTPSEASESAAQISATTLVVGQRATATITLRDGQHHALAGHAVALSGCGTSLVCTIKTAGGRTTPKGKIKVALRSHTAQAVTIAITDSTTGVSLAAHLDLVFVAATEANRSSVKVAPATQTVGSPTTVSIMLRDAGGHPLAGHSVGLAKCGPKVKKTLLTTGGKTTTTGSIQYSLTASAAATCSISVTDEDTGVTLDDRPVVAFVP